MRELGIVTVGPYNVRILIDPHLSDKEALGQFIADKMTILIAEGLPPTVEQETVAHEIEHALWYVTGLRLMENLTEEQITASLNPLRLATYRNNIVLRVLVGI